jgi:predicted ATP-dependent endonuclease of OLD family
MKLNSLIIRNFGCFGDQACEIQIDNIVVLIGQNNTGKSTVLDAYEAFASSGALLPLTSFNNELYANPIQITGVFTALDEKDINKIGKKCVYNDPVYGECIQVRWEWKEPNQKGEKYTFSAETNNFELGGAGGWDSLIASRIPIPLRIRPNDKHEIIENIITDILTSTVKETIKGDASKASKVLSELVALNNQFVTEIKTELDEATNLISKKLKDIFPDHEAEFVADIGKLEAEKIIGAGSHIRIKSSQNSLPLNNQGSGMQRAFLWAAISAMSELGKMKKGTKKIETTDRSRILLIDEPEAFLHPPTIRSAREALYALAELDNWQVMASTHSPIFVDVSKQHTTIIRVDKDDKANTKFVSTDLLGFDGNKRLELAMIRNCNPMVNEFFFADYVLLVEGETEQLVFTNLFENANIKEYVTVVSCFGKANIPTFCKILNHFGVPYIAIHDSDNPKAKKKDSYIKNSMWTINEKILEHVKENRYGSIAISQVPDFENYYFKETITSDKPYYAYQVINSEGFRTDEKYLELRNFVINITEKTHEGMYTSMEELVSRVTKFTEERPQNDPNLWSFI